MDVQTLHDWDVETEEARRLQRTLRDRVRRTGDPAPLRIVAGADCGFDRSAERLCAAVVAYDLDRDEVIERRTGVEPLTFPYVPGLLSFREMPGLLPLFESLSTEPDAVIADGHGYAHPRRFGLACHLGVFLDTPTVGCAKNVLVGSYDAPDPDRGAHEPLTGEEGDEVIGAVVRTRDNVNSVFVSVGHRVSLDRARTIVLACGRGYKLPEPQRRADLAVRDLKSRAEPDGGEPS